MQILIFGDSITQGYFDAHGGWANRLVNKSVQTTLKNLEGNWLAVFNLGVSGDTATNVLDRIDHETKARGDQSDNRIIVLAVGINDSVLLDNIAAQDVYDFQETYEKLVDKASKLATKVLCVGLSAVDENLTNPWLYSSTGKQWLNNRINLFEDTIKQVAQQKNLAFAAVHDQFIGALKKHTDLLSDGLHPNDAGHEFILSLVEPELQKLLA